MLRTQSAITIILLSLLMMAPLSPIGAQTTKPKKEKIKRTKPNSNTSAIPASYSDDLKRFMVNFNNSFKEARTLSEEYRLARVLLSDQIKDLKRVEPVQQIKIVQLESRIKALKKQEKVAKSNQKKFEGYAKSLMNIDEMTLSKQAKLIASIEMGYQKMPRVFPPPSIKPLAASERPMAQVSDPQKPRKRINKARATKTTNSSRPRSGNIPAGSYATYDRSMDVLYNPPASDCSFRYKGMDEFLGKEKKEVEPNLFFFHTDDELRPYMKGNEYIVCKAGLATSTGGLTTLNIEVTIRSQNAQREFGGLQKGNPLTVRLIDGQIVKLVSVNSDSGVYDETTGLTTFRNQFVLQKGEEKAFLESEIDKVRLVWSNGYEDYDVYHVDFMMNQINCLYSE